MKEKSGLVNAIASEVKTKYSSKVFKKRIDDLELLKKTLGTDYETAKLMASQQIVHTFITEYLTSNNRYNSFLLSNEEKKELFGKLSEYYFSKN